MNRCKDEIRAELKQLLDKTKRETAESIKTLEPPNPTAPPQAREAIETINKFSDGMI